MNTRGLAILARTLSKPASTGPLRTPWQYHPRGDRHSKAACWGILLDLLQACPKLREHVEEGYVGFAVDHVVRSLSPSGSKTLDLVIGPPRAGAGVGRTLTDLAAHWHLELSASDREALASLPVIREFPVEGVRCALETKAIMTGHIKALPRLYDELDASHQMIHGASDEAIAVAFVLVNGAPTFISPGRQDVQADPVVSTHRDMPQVLFHVMKRLRHLPRRTVAGQVGFDALGVCAVDLRNDRTTPVTILSDGPAASPDAIYPYDQMIARVAALYPVRFPAGERATTPR